jgi:hypothetical protein
MKGEQSIINVISFEYNDYTGTKKQAVDHDDSRLFLPYFHCFHSAFFTTTKHVPAPRSVMHGCKVSLLFGFNLVIAMVNIVGTHIAYKLCLAVIFLT